MNSGSRGVEHRAPSAGHHHRRAAADHAAGAEHRGIQIVDGGLRQLRAHRRHRFRLAGGAIDDGGTRREFDRAKHLGDHVGSRQAQHDRAALAGDFLRGARAQAAFGQQVVAENPIARRGQAGGDRRPEQADSDQADGVHMRLLPPGQS